MTVRRRLGGLDAALYRNGYALLASGASTSVIGMFSWMLAARQYSTHSFGVQAAVVATMLFLTGVAELALSTVLVRFLPTVGFATRSVIAVVYAIAAAAALLVSVGFVAGLQVWAPALNFLRADSRWLVAFVAATIVLVIVTLQDHALIGMRQAVWVPVETTIVAVVRICLVVALAPWLPSAGIFAAWFVAAAAAVMVTNVFIFGPFATVHRHAQRDTRKPTPLSTVGRYVSGNYAGALLFNAATYLLPLLVLNHDGATASAYFAIPWTIWNSLQLIAASLCTSLTVEAVLNREKLDLYARKVLLRILMLLVPLAALLFALAPHVLRPFGQDYAEHGADLLRWLAVASVPSAGVFVCLSLARVRTRPLLVAGVQGGASLTLLGLSYVLLPVRGIDAMGIAALISGTIFGGPTLVSVLWPLIRSRPSRFSRAR